MLLNGAALNGVALSGGTLVVIEGAASFDTPSADFTASANQIWAATANAVGNAEAVASATRGVLPEVVLTGSGELYTNPHVDASGAAAVSGSAEFVAFVIRLIEAQAGFSCSALFDVVAQGAFGAANFDGEASLSAGATRIQDGGTASASGTASVAADALVTRYVEATATLGTADFTAAYRVTSGGVTTYYSGAALSGTGDLYLDPDFIFYNSAALFNGSVEIAPSATQQQFGSAEYSCTATVNALLGILVYPAATFSGSASLAADPTRGVLPSADFDAASSVSASMVQQHAVTCSLSCGCEVTATPTVTGALESNTAASADFTAQATRFALPSAACDGECSIYADPINLFKLPGEAVCDAAADVYAFTTVLRLGEAAFGGACTFFAEAVNLEKTQAESAVAANAEFFCDVIVLRLGVAAFACTGGISADARTNLDADDPPERTMNRPFTDRMMRRPFVDRIMREAA